MTRTENDRKSLIMMIGVMMIYGTIGIFRKYIPLSSALLACFRGFSGGFLLLIIMLLRRKHQRLNISRAKVLLLILSGVAIGLNWILLFEAYRYTTVATATLCYYMQPTIVMLVSPLLFQEKLTIRKRVCAAAALVGMAFVSGIFDGGLPSAGDAKGILFGLGAAALYSAVVIMNMKLPGLDAYQKTFIQLISAAVVLLPYILLTEDFSAISLDGMQIVLLLIVGFLHTGLAYAAYFGSMDGLKAQTVALIGYIDPVTALILSALFLHEPFTIFAGIGAVLILGAAFLSEFHLRKPVD